MARYSIITSAKDPAGINIRSNLIDLFKFEKTGEKFDDNDVFEYRRYKDKNIKLYLINDELIFSENIDKKIETDFLIFASKHRSASNAKSFAVHPIGNWSKADFGGQEKKLCPSSAILLKRLFLSLNDFAKDSGFEITLEATHHGPYTEKPSVFVEIGSTEEEWKDRKNGEILAGTVMKGIETEIVDQKIAVGIGGSHYCNNFNKILLRTDIAVSHICPKYRLESIDAGSFRESILRTPEKFDFFLLDWKGLGKEKQKIMEMFEGSPFEVKRADKVLGQKDLNISVY